MASSIKGFEGDLTSAGGNILGLPSQPGFDPTHHIAGMLSDYAKSLQKSIKDQNSDTTTKPLGADKANTDSLQKIATLVSQLTGANPGGNVPAPTLAAPIQGFQDNLSLNTPAPAPTGQPEPKPTSAGMINNYLQTAFPDTFHSSVADTVNHAMATPDPNSQGFDSEGQKVGPLAPGADILPVSSTAPGTDTGATVGGTTAPGATATGAGGPATNAPPDIHANSNAIRDAASQVLHSMGAPPPAQLLKLGTKDLLGLLATAIGAISGPGGGAMAASSYLSGRQAGVDRQNQIAQNAYQIDQQHKEQTYQDLTNRATAASQQEEFKATNATQNKKIEQSAIINAERVAANLVRYGNANAIKALATLKATDEPKDRYQQAVALQKMEPNLMVNQFGEAMSPQELNQWANQPTLRGEKTVAQTTEIGSKTDLNVANTGKAVASTGLINAKTATEKALLQPRVDYLKSKIGLTDNRARLVAAQTQFLPAMDQMKIDQGYASIDNLKSLVGYRTNTNQINWDKLDQTQAATYSTNLRSALTTTTQNIREAASEIKFNTALRLNAKTPADTDTANAAIAQAQQKMDGARQSQSDLYDALKTAPAPIKQPPAQTTNRVKVKGVAPSGRHFEG